MADNSFHPHFNAGPNFTPGHDHHDSDDALYGVSREFKNQIVKTLDDDNISQLLLLVTQCHAADIADLIRILRPDERRRFLTATKSFLNADILAELDDSVREEVVEILGPRIIAAAAINLDTDDAIELIEDLSDDQQQQVLQAMPADARALLEQVLSYPNDSAGRMMQREIVCVPPFWTVGETISFMRDMDDIATRYYDVYVVDSRGHLKGSVPLGNLLKNSLEQPVLEIMLTDMHPIPVDTDREEVALTFQHYALVSAPVIDESDRLVGMITVDDVVHVIKEEAEEDIMHLASVSESDFYAPVITTAYWRMRWLIVTLLTSLLSAVVIAQFQGAIQKVTALAFLMPVSAALGGSSGMQVVTIVVRALATRALREGNTWRAVGKEVYVSLIIGGVFSLASGIAVSLIMHDHQLAVILSAGIFLNMLWASVAGTLIPITLHFFKLDPAISAGPILMTTTDIFGFAIFLGLATLLLI